MNQLNNFILQLIGNYVLLFILIVILFKYIEKLDFRDPKLVNFSKKLPGPFVYPIIGNSLNVILGGKDGYGSLFNYYRKEYGPVVRLWIGKRLVILISDVEEIETVLLSSNCLEKSTMSETLQPLLGNSLGMAVPLPVWKQKRKEFLPFFIKRNLYEIIPVMNELIYKYITKLEDKVNGPEFDVGPFMSDLSFDTITTSHLNFKLSDRERKELGLSQKIETSFLRLSSRYFYPWSVVQIFMDLIQPTNAVATRKLGFSFTDKILSANGLSIPRNDMEDDLVRNEISEPDTLGQSYLKKLIQMEKDFREPNFIHYEILGIILGGTESSSIFMGNCLLALAANPKVQENLYQEINQVFGDDDRPAGRSDLSKLPYLEQVIKETHRRFTVAPATIKEISNDTKIGTLIYPAGTVLFINMEGIHHNPLYYPNPFEFNPNNFTPEAIRNRHRLTFLPFGGGPRHCIGKSFAELSIKLRIIALLRKFRFHTTAKLDKIKYKRGLFQSSANGYPISITRREKNQI